MRRIYVKHVVEGGAAEKAGNRFSDILKFTDEVGLSKNQKKESV